MAAKPQKLNNKVNKKVISIWASSDMDDRLTRFAAQTGLRKGKIAERAIEEFLAANDTADNPLIVPEVHSLNKNILSFLQFDLRSSTNIVANVAHTNPHTTSWAERTLETSPKQPGTFSQSMEHNLITLFPDYEHFKIDILQLQGEALQTQQGSKQQHPQPTPTPTSTRPSPVISADHTYGHGHGNDNDNDNAQVEVAPNQFIESTPLRPENTDTPEDALSLLQTLGPPPENVDEDDLDDFTF